jgi:hypothetical protein
MVQQIISDKTLKVGYAGFLSDLDVRFKLHLFEKFGIR